MTLGVIGCGGRGAGLADAFAVQQNPDRVIITDDGRPVATYVFRDDKILRPYFANVHAPGGIQVTRNHPPVPNVDATDHDTMHPGVWLAFGDLSGQGGLGSWHTHSQFKDLKIHDAEGTLVDTDDFSNLDAWQPIRGQ